MTVKELSEKFDKLIKDHQPEFSKEWEKEISFKHFQIIYEKMLQNRKKF